MAFSDLGSRFSFCSSQISDLGSPVSYYFFAVHLYIHVPFCARRCSYCDFAIAVRAVTPSREFATEILTEWHQRKQALAPDEPLATIYFGGGTPSRLDPASIAEIIALIAREHPRTADCEVTLETNPDDVTPERARAWANAGVNRISLGVQSHDPTVLEWMHRTHRADQVAPAIAVLRDAGISNISVDLIFALPTALQRDWSRDLALTFAFEPTHVSLYGLTVEAHTPLAHWIERGETTATPEESYVNDYLLAHQELVSHGFEHYEVSNAGLPGKHSRHNRGYWRGIEYLGLGPSAHSYLKGIRSWNIREWAKYAATVASGRSPVEASEELNAASQLLERRYLGLRTSHGVARDDLPESVQGLWRNAGWGEDAGDRFRLTTAGWLRLDALVASIGSG